MVSLPADIAEALRTYYASLYNIAGSSEGRDKPLLFNKINSYLTASNMPTLPDHVIELLEAPIEFFSDEDPCHVPVPRLGMAEVHRQHIRHLGWA